MKKFCSLAIIALLTGSGWASLEILEPDRANVLEFEPVSARYVRIVVDGSVGEPCIDELELMGPGEGDNLALASLGAVASASSCLPGYEIHQVAHLNDGLYGNAHSWIAAGRGKEWAQIALPQKAEISRIVFSRDREGVFRDRMPTRVEVLISLDGEQWTLVKKASSSLELPDREDLTEEALLQYAFACEALSWKRFDSTGYGERILDQYAALIDRLSAQGLAVDQDRRMLHRIRDLLSSEPTPEEKDEAIFRLRMAKRRLFFRAPELEGMQRILFVKRQPFEPSHNYSVIFDAAGGPGGGVCILEIPWVDGRLEPSAARVKVLFDSGEGVARDPVASQDGSAVYFGYKKSLSDFFHIWRSPIVGEAPAVCLTDGPFHDYFPCVLPDGGIAFTSTRCRARFLCWRPQAFVLFRMDADGRDIRPLSFANLSEWTPSVMRDGRILWMRSEYLDKGADFGHTLWAIRPDGTHPELIFGNNTLNCYANGREVPGSRELVCTLVSHGGDLNGPIALIDMAQGRYQTEAITSITPDVPAHYHMSWARQQCFRDPYPVSRDYFLCSHAPMDRFGLYVIDRYGNRELLYLDPDMGSMSPSLLNSWPGGARMPVAVDPELARGSEGLMVLSDVYEGLGPAVEPGRVRYIRVCEEVKSGLEQLSDGTYRADHEPFQDWYATPTHLVTGPNGWPSYVAKSVLGTVPVEEDGSACFRVPAGRVVYLQALDGAFNEIQRMRSVVQMRPGEVRGCIGCHEDRMSAPPSAGRTIPTAVMAAPRSIEPPEWGAGPFSYPDIVQPVWDRRCVGCHDARDKDGFNLEGASDEFGVPASFRTLIEGGWVHYFDYTWGREHSKALPMTFGTLKSPLWEVLDSGHYDVQLTPEERRRIKCWTDLNCPLWPDYQFRPERLVKAGS
jgi:hypothetical protein